MIPQPFNIKELLKRLPKRFAARLLLMLLASLGVSVPLIEEHPLEGMVWHLLESEPNGPADAIALPPAYNPNGERPTWEGGHAEPLLSDSVWRARRKAVPNTPPLSPKKENAKRRVTDSRPKSERIGCVCRDGTLSEARGRGACSGHGGVARWVFRGENPEEVAYAVIRAQEAVQAEVSVAAAQEIAQAPPPRVQPSHHWLEDFRLMDFVLLLVVAVVLIALFKKAL